MHSNKKRFKNASLAVIALSRFQDKERPYLLPTEKSLLSVVMEGEQSEYKKFFSRNTDDLPAMSAAMEAVMRDMRGNSNTAAILEKNPSLRQKESPRRYFLPPITTSKPGTLTNSGQSHCSMEKITEDENEANGNDSDNGVRTDASTELHGSSLSAEKKNNISKHGRTKGVSGENTSVPRRKVSVTSKTEKLLKRSDALEVKLTSYQNELDKSQVNRKLSKSNKTVGKALLQNRR
ncbi:uncharacterized protein LOC130623690 isoform X2 [Hydractinia symbiolongicarpus]|nr:uncharacterized protein LOC130623690 isoform X2 [Hydractinia symbiolongicarpus]XP_057295185.1 uncharacterized protein LOC130623690 isoform X2 [Hydractinia symbiolongicarpus]